MTMQIAANGDDQRVRGIFRDMSEWRRIATPYTSRAASAAGLAGNYQFPGADAVLRAVSRPNLPSSLPCGALLSTLSLALMLAACGSQPTSTPGVPPPITGPDGEPARSVTLSLPRIGFDGRIDGDVSLAALRDKVVAVTYFTVWCQPCAETLPRIAKLAEELDGFEYIAVSLDDQPRAMVPAFVEYLRLEPGSLQIAVADAAHKDARTPFGRLLAVPVTHLVDGGGRHIETLYGVPQSVYLHRRVLELSARDGTP